MKMCKLKVVWIFSVVCIFLSFLTIIDANVLRDPHICGQPKCSPSSKFKYNPSVVYHYGYNVTVNTWFAKSSENQSVFIVQSEVSLQFITQCEGLLKINAVSIKDQDETYVQERNESFASALSHNALRFAFHDGVITEICPEDGEEEWAINFKRGVLSLFQNTMTRFDIDHKGLERDIHGTCDTEYKMHSQEDTSLIVMKKKDLSQCMDRYKYLSILQTVRYNFQSKFQTWPVLQSETRCRITIDHKIYSAVSCRERHLFEPFSGRQSGATTTVIQDLKIIREINTTNDESVRETTEEWSEIKLRFGLLHHHVPPTGPTTGDLRTARDLLKQLCKVEEARSDSEFQETTNDENKMEGWAEDSDGGSVVGLWGSFVRSCRPLQYAALAQLLSRAATICPQARKHVLDALPYIASSGSVELIKEKIVGNRVSEEIKKEWLMSLTMIPRPTREMITSMGELLGHNTTDKYVSLAASSMVHSYCRNSHKTLDECCNENQNMIIINIFQQNAIQVLNQNYGINLPRAQREKAIISIKAMGNIGGFSTQFGLLLREIIGNQDISLPIRLYAVDAFRKTPCFETRAYFLQMFGDQTLDVEVRIASYLQVMRCPTYVITRKILQFLREEKINQVASFVWSHLENLGKSTIPSRVEKQGLLSGNTIPRPTHRPDIRKFSRNYEHGVFFDQYNAGGNYEANLIMSPDSYIPRSASLNLTVDMFGESINILELNARGEGFEKYVEEIFGPNGPFGKTTIDDYMHYLRFLRSPSDADTVRNRVEAIDYKNEALDHRSPLLDLGMKVFGNEISFWSGEGDDEIRDGIRQLNPLYHINKILSGKEISYKKSSLFLDTTYSVPTGSGMPLTMNLMGTSVVNLKMSGSISGADKFFQKKDLDFEGKMHPSMALNIAATMGVIGGGLGGTGIRVNLRLHTATALAAKVRLRSGTLASVSVSMPHSKQEIFEAKSELIILHGNKEVQQVGISKDKVQESTCSWTAVDIAFGIKVCATYEFPNVTDVTDAPYFIMAGPARYLLSLEKVDPTAKVYSFLYSWESNKTASILSFSFDTPGSKTKRMFNASVSSLVDTGTAVMSFQSSHHVLKAHATYKNLPDYKLIECVLDIDGQKHFDAVLSLNKQDQKNGFIYIPRVYVAVNNERITELAGTLRYATKKGVSQWDVSLEFQTKRLASRLIGYITWNGPSKGAKLRLDYQFLDERKETIKIDTLVSNRELGMKRDFYCELGLEFTSYPHLNFFADAKYMVTQNHLECNFNLSSSRLLQGDDAKFQYSLARHRTLDGFKIQHHIKIQKPYLDIYYNYEEDSSTKTLSTTAAYDKLGRSGGLIGVWGKIYMPSGMSIYVEAALNATLPSLTPLAVTVKLHEKRTNEFDIHAQGVWFTGTDATLAAYYHDQSVAHLASRRLKAVLTSTTFEKIAFDAKYTQDNRQLNFNVRGDQNEDHYGVTGRYVLYSENNFTCYGQLDMQSKTYSIRLVTDMHNDTNVIADIHIDQLRDIHVTYLNINRKHMKKLSADINWDANRDPNRKLSVGLELLDRGVLNYAGSVLLFYPGRLINGEFDFLVKDWLCQWLVKLAWSPDDNILWRVKLYSEMQKESVYALLSEMDTPFQGWRDTSLNLMWRYFDNMQSVNGNMTWERERLVFSLMGDYMLKTNEIFGEISGLVNSTLPTLPTVAAIARHHHQWRKTSDTLLSFEYNNDGLMMVNSSWRFDRTSTANNISGRVAMKSPFQGYKTGLLVTQLMFNHKRDVEGLTHLDIDEKIYTITVDGHMTRFTNNMLSLNVTSPNPTYSLMEARFGLSDTDRHLVAMIQTPNFTTGVELLLRLASMQDFHVFGHIALPVDLLQNTKMSAKRNSEEVDFRIGWAEAEFGFTGIWHYNSIADFQYLYKVFTGFKGYEENGLVLKNIYTGGLDSEVSIRLSKHKVGVALLIKNNGKGLLKIIEEQYFTKIKKRHDQLVEDFSTDIFVTVNMINYPTIKFDAQLNKVDGPTQEEIFKIKADLHLPNRTLFRLTDKFVLQDFTTMTNDLHLFTPFPQLSELKSHHTVDIILEEKYNMTIVNFIRQGTQKWHEISVRAFYEHDTGEDHEYSTHTAELLLVTQVKALETLAANLQYHNEGSLNKLMADIKMPSCQITSKGQLDMDETSVDLNGALNLTSPLMPPYNVRVEFKKYFMDNEKTVSAGLHVQQAGQSNYLMNEVAWRPGFIGDHLKVKVRCALAEVLLPSDLALTLSHEPSEMYRALRAEGRMGSRDMIYSLLAENRKSHISVILATPHRGFRNLTLKADLIDNNLIRGVFRGDTVVYNIDGRITSQNPLKIETVLRPTNGGQSYTVRLQYARTKDTYSLTTSLLGTVSFTLFGRLENGKTFVDLSIKVDSSHEHFENMFVKSRLELTPGGHVMFGLQAKTPLESLQTVNADADITLTSRSGAVICVYNVTHLSGDADLKWSFVVDDTYLKALARHVLKGKSRSFDLNSYYFNNYTQPTKMDTTDLGFYVDMDNSWKVGSNISVVTVANQRADAAVNVLLPSQDRDTHTFKVGIDAVQPAMKNINLVYSTDVSRNILALKGKIYLPASSLHTNITLDWGTLDNLQTIDNKLEVEIVNNQTVGVAYILESPLFKGEETFKLKGTYDNVRNDFIVINGIVHYPGSNQIADVDLAYGGLRHTVGRINTTTPFENLPWLATDARISNEKLFSENMIQVFWSNLTVLMNATHKVSKGPEDSIQTTGIVLFEIPVNKKHVIMADYAYVESRKWSRGNATIHYNGQQFVQRIFRSTSETGERNLLRDTVEIEIDNSMSPIGIHYVHQYGDGGNTDIKQASIYELRNATNFNLTGRIDVEAWKAGKHVKLMVIQGDRTIRLENNYESGEKNLFQGSKLVWAPEVWLQYDIQIQNKTQGDLESQELNVNVMYPNRSFKALAVYSLRETFLDGGATLKWSLDGDNKTVRLDGRWDNPEIVQGINKHDVRFTLSHPSFSKDVTLLGKYSSDIATMSNMSVILEYSDYENERLTFNTILKDFSNGPTRDYSIEVDCKHPATDLDLVVKSEMNMQYNVYHVNNYYKYQKTVFHETIRHGAVLLDLRNHLLHYEYTKDNEWFNMNTTWSSMYPEYKVLASVNRTSGNDTGVWVISAKDKSILAHFNKSDDVSYHLIGQIIDARSAELGAWRDFDDVKTIDISSYIRLNHSRLLTSRISWRPEIYQEVKSNIGQLLKTFYLRTYEVLVMWKSIPLETHAVLKNVWSDAKPKVREFLEDVDDLHVIKLDIEQFHEFLNVSYNANEFYIKDIVEFSIHIMDELSLRNHIESLPDIVNEMLQMMGETKHSLRQSILWIIETLKTSYAKLMERISKILEEDFMEQVSEMIEAGILKYDSFVKQMHLSFIHYCETTWYNVISKLNEFWRNLLKSLEPTFLKFVHYVETFFWKFSSELLDFVYARTNELRESPYFTMLSTLTQDLDSFWKDIHNNDAVTNIKKYTGVFMNFFNDKILIHIPFQKEFKEIATEIWNELNQLQELSVVKFFKAKFWEAKGRLQWWYDYFKVGEALDIIFDTLYKKMTEVAKTALQLEETHRVAKTNFIFDVRKGLLFLEQKIPVPWHAFNRTPAFTEVAEYKMVHNLMDTWLLSNFSVMSYYYDFMPYLYVHNLLPPFTGHALISGHGTVVTMDRQVYTITKPGTFLLSADFLAQNFTILVQSESPGKYKLVLLGKKSLVHVDLFEESVTVGGSAILSLPSKVDDWIIERDEEYIKIDNVNGVNIRCKFLFKTCLITMDGWYFSRLGGLFGTMNNEPFDDMLKPNMQPAETTEEFVDSWKIIPGSFSNPPQPQLAANETVCEAYFKNKVSPLKACFPMIDAASFYDECITGLDPCILANIYMELCLVDHIPIRTPEKCLECISPSGEVVEEGSFNYVLNVTNAMDVVFIVEAHDCNMNIRREKNLDVFINTLETKLNNHGLTDNRYTVVAFGGSNVYKRARSLYVKNKVFAKSKEIADFFDILTIEPVKKDNISSYAADTFEALSLASRLNFRPGVSKTFFLFPCTKCEMISLQLDYSVVHQVLMDSSVTLHIVMDDDFTLGKKRIAKTLFGIDSTLAYTTKDVRELVGDAELRQQIKLPKAKLGFCASLAMETNGTIFVSSKMKSSEPGGGRRAAGVLGERAARSSRPCERARCECHASRFKCTPSCTRSFAKSTIGDISLSIWDSSEMDYYIDNFLDIPVPTLTAP